MLQRSPRLSPHLSALLALLLIVPAQMIGTLMSLVIAPGTIGQTVLFLTKSWMLLLPIAWFLWVDRQPVSVPKPGQRELIAGTILGLAMGTIILAAYWLIGRHWIDSAEVRREAQRVGVLMPVLYLAGASFWIFINSLLEEYVWRWFVYRKCEVLVPDMAAVFLSALLFTLHHVIDLSVYFTDWRVIGLGSLAVFAAGATWSGCYLVYRSIWASYVSHLLADGAIALVGWHLLFV